MCVTETFLAPSDSFQLSVEGDVFSVFRKDRTYSSGGGVCILTRDSTITANLVNVPSAFCDIEVVSIDILNGSTPIRLINVYRPPASDTDSSAIADMEHLINCLQSLSDVDSTVIITGDFNLPKIDWSDPVIMPDVDNCSSLFTVFTKQFVFEQLVTEVTRPSTTKDSAGSLIDLVLCNDSFAVNNVSVVAPFSTSDHCAVRFDLCCFSTPPVFSNYEQCFNKYNFQRADWSSINNALSLVNWADIFAPCDNCDELSYVFYSTIDDCINRFVPRYLSRGKRQKARYPPSVNKLFRKKLTAWKLYKKFRTTALLSKFKLISSQCRKAVYQSSLKYEQNIIDSSNIGKFFRYANSKLKAKTSVGSLRMPDGQVTCNPADKVELLSQYFSSKFSVDNGCLPSQSAPSHRHSLTDIVFTPGLVARAIKKLKAKSAGGPDSVPPIFLKSCVSHLAEPLAFVYQIFFNASYLPPVWLKAFITPIYKKGDSTLPSNYRPISLTCTLCKLMEVITKDQVMSFLLAKGLISREQHAFIARHSTVTNLLECTNDWAVSFHNRVPTDVVYVDFSRAFDSVVHKKLLYKLGSFGISGKLLLWIEAFLSGRSQSVLVQNHCSSWVEVTSGVPQGSVLGPILFILFINDIVSIGPAGTTAKLFADDLKLYSSIESMDSILSLQLALDNLLTWCRTWQLEVNISKTCVLHLHKSNSKHVYYYNGVVIPSSSTVTDLGVHIDSELRFDKHIRTIIGKAYSRIGLIFRGFVSRDLSFLKQAYITYVRPVLEYATQVWSPYLLKHIRALEAVQRHFTRRIPSLIDLSYPERLALLDLETLELRRLKADLVLYYKIYNNLTPWPSDLYLSHFGSTKCTRTTNSAKLTQPLCHTNMYSNNFFNRAISCWNSLPNSVVNACSLHVFKAGICKVDFSNFLLYSE